jgi:single-stranded-DNA-specific exonuclease
MMRFTNAKERIQVKPADRDIVQRLQNDLNVPFGIAYILAGRNLRTFDECKAFFRPDCSSFYDPFLFKDMEAAVDRISAAIKNKEKIFVYGDYDVDGVTSTAVMVRCLRTLGADCDYYLPNRLKDGYGVSEAGIKHIAESGATLMVTVDCGITAINEIVLAKKMGIDCIITDHHEPKEILPSADALINPKIDGANYPDKNLAGVGVALKVCQALAIRTCYGEELWKPVLDLVSLGTAADIVPMVGENRIIARLGFAMLSNSGHAGLRELISQQGLAGKPISTSQVVFQIAPCINAVGRLGDPRRGVELLLTNDSEKAKVYANDLRGANTERRSLDSAVAEEAAQWVYDNCDMEEDFAIVIGKPHWHVGVIGIVASKLVEKFHRPSILLSIGADGIAKGSGRSIPGLHLLNALNGCSGVLESFGGHAAAAGMSCKRENIDTFREQFNAMVKKMLTPEDLLPLIEADAEISLSEISPKFFRIIKEMEPFGPGNMRPVLFSKGLQHKTEPRLVGNNHIKMMLTGDGITMDAIGFNMGDRFKEVKGAGNLALAFSLDENEWNGRVNLQMKIKGFSV